MRALRFRKALLRFEVPALQRSAQAAHFRAIARYEAAIASGTR